MPGGGWQWTAGSNFGDPVGPRAWVNGTYGGVPKAGVVDQVRIGAKAGPMVVQATTMATARAIGAAAARCLALANPWCAAGTAAAAAYETYRIYGKDYGGLPGGHPAQGLTVDQGVPQVNVPGYRDSESVCYGSSPVEVAQCTWDRSRAQYPNGNLQIGPTNVAPYCDGPDGLSCHWSYQVMLREQNGNLTFFTNAGWNQTVFSSVVQKCPASVDPYDSQFSLPSGLAPGADGKCRTARGNHVPATEGDATDKWAASPPPGPAIEQTAKDAVGAGEQLPGEVSSEGPASQTGQPSQTTTTSGTGTTTTTTTNTYNYHYGGDKITYTTITNTTVTNNAGDVISSTETTTPPAPQDDEKDPCAAAPDRLGCIKLGQAPTDQIPKTSREVSYEQVDVGGMSGCPAPVGLPGGKQISYQVLCDGLVQARPLVIAIGLFIAAGIVAAALRA